MSWLGSADPKHPAEKLGVIKRNVSGCCKPLLNRVNNDNQRSHITVNGRGEVGSCFNGVALVLQITHCSSDAVFPSYMNDVRPAAGRLHSRCRTRSRSV